MIKKIFLSGLILAGMLSTQAQQRVPMDQIVKVVSYLASDELNGRGTGTADEKKAAKFIAEQFEAMHLKPKGYKGYFYDFLYKHDTNIHDTIKANVKPKIGRNVLAFLDNGAENTIVIGAHYDHCGLGFDGNSLDANPKEKIHNGADDNASGVAGVLALAHYLSTNGFKEKNNFLFMTFSGEELGLLGSKKWCERPTFPLEKINYMINLDMLGRLNDSTKKLLVYGIGTSDVFKETIDQNNAYFSIKYDSAGVGPSDQTSFYLKDIPVLHFFTGQHSDYHKPTDDADKINFKGEEKVLELIIDVINDLDTKPKLKFFKTKSVDMGKTSFKVTMGIMPDYAFDEGLGMRIDGVTDGKPASKAGILKGDIVLKLGTHKVGNVQDYMKALGHFNKGDKTTVTIKRGSDIEILNIQF